LLQGATVRWPLRDVLDATLWPGPNRWEAVMQNQSVVGIGLAPGRQLAFCASVRSFGSAHSLSWQGNRVLRLSLRPRVFAQTDAGSRPKRPALGLFAVLHCFGKKVSLMIMSPDFFEESTACWVNRCDSRNRPVVSLDPCFSENHRTCHGRVLRCPSPLCLAVQTGRSAGKLKSARKA